MIEGLKLIGLSLLAFAVAVFFYIDDGLWLIGFIPVPAIALAVIFAVIGVGMLILGIRDMISATRKK